MAESDPKADLRRYLQAAREALLWKLEGLSEYDVRRPMVARQRRDLGMAPDRPAIRTAMNFGRRGTPRGAGRVFQGPRVFALFDLPERLTEPEG